jgi:hypothetical protein
MRLTNREAWDTYAGGTCAASDRNAYQSRATIGNYSIQPISSKYNVCRHIGYRVHFLNVFGKLSGGLWQNLGVVTLPEARRRCQKHMVENGGEYVSGGPVGRFFFATKAPAN